MKNTLPEFKEILRAYGASIGRDFNAVAVRNLYAVYLSDTPNDLVGRALTHLTDVRRASTEKMIQAQCRAAEAHKAAMARAKVASMQKRIVKQSSKTAKRRAELKEGILLQVKNGSRMISDFCFNLKTSRATARSLIDELLHEGKLKIHKALPPQGGALVNTYWLTHECIPKPKPKPEKNPDNYCKKCNKVTERSKHNRCRICAAVNARTNYEKTKNTGKHAEYQRAYYARPENVEKRKARDMVKRAEIRKAEIALNNTITEAQKHELSELIIGLLKNFGMEALCDASGYTRLKIGYVLVGKGSYVKASKAFYTAAEILSKRSEVAA